MFISRTTENVSKNLITYIDSALSRGANMNNHQICIIDLDRVTKSLYIPLSFLETNKKNSLPEDFLLNQQVDFIYQAACRVLRKTTLKNVPNKVIYCYGKSESAIKLYEKLIEKLQKINKNNCEVIISTPFKEYKLKTMESPFTYYLKDLISFLVDKKEIKENFLCNDFFIREKIFFSTLIRYHLIM